MRITIHVPFLQTLSLRSLDTPGQGSELIELVAPRSHTQIVERSLTQVEQGFGRIVLHDTALVHHQNSVARHDGLDVSWASMKYYCHSLGDDER